MIVKTPPSIAEIIKFMVLTGLRPTEAIESDRLLTLKNSNLRKISSHSQYYNPERQCLEHFRFPEIFLRRTKKAC